MSTKWEIIGFAKRSKNRQKAIKILEKPMMPSELGKEMKISLTHASKIIRELHSKQLVECLNEQLKVGRIYKTSKRGKSILKFL
jgi:predicted transcriptional regulator